MDDIQYVLDNLNRLNGWSASAGRSTMVHFDVDLETDNGEQIMRFNLLATDAIRLLKVLCSEQEQDE